MWKYYTKYLDAYITVNNVENEGSYNVTNILKHDSGIFFFSYEVDSIQSNVSGAIDRNTCIFLYREPLT